ncbi:gustatory and pheromone receptor 39a-like [Ischnura elegans]|uniref:gustatory and pheromone receptor 39a-like n=1 Tax=Ischnura elegans TaxID=197161 RepID=UPI001ED8911F|nr:gustatory and pheromone receptor 39a-like [Ischnura elegans]
MLLLLATSTSLIFHRERIKDVLFRTNEVFRKSKGTSISRRRLETFVWAHCIALWSILILGCSHILVRKFDARMLGSILQFLSHVTVTAISLQFSILLRVVLLSLRYLNAQISIVFRRFLEQSELRRPQNATLTSEVPGAIVARRLRHLARQHLAMCGVARDLNAIYGVNALVHSTQILMDLAYHSFIMAELIGGIAHGFSTSHYLLDLFIWNVPTLSSLAHSVMQCQAASLENFKHNMLTNDPTVFQIRRFSNQIHHSQAKFSGAGFVSLDYSLFVKIAAAAFSNVIILAQFQSYVVPAK